jgi:hypothetical protein
MADCRVNMIKLLRTPDENKLPQSFLEQVAKYRVDFLATVTTTMSPLIGPNHEQLHKEIVRIAERLLMIRTAYAGSFESFSLGIEEKIDLSTYPVRYELQNPPEQDTSELDGSPCLVTTMMGIKYSLAGKGSRMCSPAVVEHWPQDQLKTRLDPTPRTDEYPPILPVQKLNISQKTPVKPRRKRKRA